MSAWHVTNEVAGAYVHGVTDDVTAASIEAHVVACAACRNRVATSLPPMAAARLDALWAGVVDAVDRPLPSLTERLLSWLRVPSGEARLIAATPSLRLSWFVAVAATLGLAVLAAYGSDDSARMFLGLAPLLPVAGVAMAFGRGADPAYELATAAPYSLVRLLLLRTTAVLTTSAIVIAVASALLPQVTWSPLSVLLPALALTLVTLAVSTAVAPAAAAAGTALAWLMLIGGAQRRIPVDAITGAAAQSICAALAVAAALVLVARRDRIDLGGTP